MTIVDSMRDALEAALMKGIKPSAIELGPVKWRQWRQFVNECVAAEDLSPIENYSETFGGITVQQMHEPGIRVG